MASLRESSGSVLTSAAKSEAMGDGRGFTTGGAEHAAPDFEGVSPSKRAANKKISRARPFPLIPMPVVAVSPEDLDLEGTLVAGESFLSSGGSAQACNNLADYHSTGNSTSYSKAVIRGKLDTSHMVW